MYVLSTMNSRHLTQRRPHQGKQGHATLPLDFHFRTVVANNTSLKSEIVVLKVTSKLGIFCLFFLLTRTTGRKRLNSCYTGINIQEKKRILQNTMSYNLQLPSTKITCPLIMSLVCCTVISFGTGNDC